MTTSMQAVLARIADKSITPEEGAKLLDALMPKSNGFPASQWGNATPAIEDGMLVLRCKLDGTEKSKVRTDAKGKVTGGKVTMLCKAGGSVQDGARKVRYGVSVYCK